jgi:hypothetical protein
VAGSSASVRQTTLPDLFGAVPEEDRDKFEATGPGWSCYRTRLVRPAEQEGELFLTLGGGLALEFRAMPR